MSIKKVSVTKTSTFTVDGEGKVTRERIVELSHDWTEKDVILFKKIAKQGGICKIKGNKYTVIPGEKITTSKGWADAGVGKMPGPE
jgi:hypothetical protein